MNQLPERPQFSIIIPCYNHEQFLARAIESVLSQAVACEIIVVDDGSQDASRHIAAAFGEVVRLAVQTNQGVSAARNHGLHLASADWIVFLDSDDFLLPGALSRMAGVITQDPQADVVYGGTRIVDEVRGPVRDILPCDLSTNPLERLLASNVLTTGSLCIRREFCERVGPLDTAINHMEDWDYWIRLAAAGARFQRISEPVVAYRKHGLGSSLQYRNMVRGVRYVLTKHKQLARRSWRTWWARQCGRRAMRYFCWRQLLLPQLTREFRQGRWSSVVGQLAAAVTQDRQSLQFFLWELWLLTIAAQCVRTVEVCEPLKSGPLVPDHRKLGQTLR